LHAAGPRHRNSGFSPTHPDFEHDSEACRIYGTVIVKKVTGNLHISSFSPFFMSEMAEDNKHPNMSHIVHELSFGPYFPSIAEPLEASLELSDDRT